jgi:hypothetical protein
MAIGADLVIRGNDHYFWAKADVAPEDYTALSLERAPDIQVRAFANADLRGIEPAALKPIDVRPKLDTAES